MCIIVYKPADTDLPTRETLERCFEANHDGAGFMFRYGDRIEVRKGFLTFDALCAALEDEPLVTDWRPVELGIHFRFATHGKKDGSNCHPFPISQNVGTLRATSCRVRAALMHNGIIPEFSKTESDASDTRLFVKVLADMRNIDENAKFLLSGRGKFLLMTPRTTLLVGDFEDEAGISYSNDGYKEPTAQPAYAYGNVWNYSGFHGGAAAFTRKERKRYALARDCLKKCQRCPVINQSVDSCIDSDCQTMSDIIDDDLMERTSDSCDISDGCGGCPLTPHGEMCKFFDECYNNNTDEDDDALRMINDEQEARAQAATTDAEAQAKQKATYYPADPYTYPPSDREKILAEARERAAVTDAEAKRNGERLLARAKVSLPYYTL